MSDSKYYRILPKTYSKLTNRMIKEIKEKDCLFMRKVGKECSGLM